MLGLLNPGCFFSSPSTLQKEESVFLSVVLMVKHMLSQKGKKTDGSMVNANVYKSTKMVDVCVTSVGDGSLRVEQKQA